MDKVVKVLYFSRGGNTKRLAEAVARGAGAAEMIAVEKGQDIDIGSADILFVGGSIYAGGIDPTLRDCIATLNPKQVGKVAVFGSSMRGNMDARGEVEGLLEGKDIPVDAKSFHCKGAFLLFNRNRPNEADLQAAELFAAEVAGKA